VASVFKPRGERRYVILYKDENGRRRKVRAGSDKDAARRLANALENRVRDAKAGLLDPVAEKIAAAGRQPLGAHLDAWRDAMDARGLSAHHSHQSYDRAARLAAVACGARPSDLIRGRTPEAQERAARKLAEYLAGARLVDLTPERIQSALARLRESGRANGTVNGFLGALRSFCTWLIDTRRLRDNPTRGVSGFNPEEDRRHVRRSLTDDELSRLVRAAEGGRTLFRMSGPMRAMAYRVAAASGLRVNELRALTKDSFALEGPETTLSLPATATKNGHAVVAHPLPAALGRDLSAWLRDKPPGEPVFPLHHETAKAIKVDLEAACVEYETSEGCADFHSLRSFYVTRLIRAGATIKEVQTLARHARPETTLAHYAKVSPQDLRGVVESLPAAVSPATALALTGTDPGPIAPAGATGPGRSRRNLISKKGLASDCRRPRQPLS
jgi:integrase